MTDDNSALAESLPEKNFRPSKGLSRKRLQLIECMVEGGLSAREAAKRLGLTGRAANYALSEPAFLAELRKAKVALREGLRPKALLKLDALMDTAKSEKVALDAAKFLASEDPGTASVHLGMSLSINVTPGYTLLVAPPKHDRQTDDLWNLLERAGSSRSVLDIEGDG